MIVFGAYFHILRMENIRFVWKIKLKESVFFEAR